MNKGIRLAFYTAFLLSVTACLPKAVHNRLYPSVFGAEMDQISSNSGLDQMAATDETWTRRNAVIWSSIEPAEGAPYNWNVMVAMEAELKSASKKGIQVILIVRSTPE